LQNFCVILPICVIWGWWYSFYSWWHRPPYITWAVSSHIHTYFHSQCCWYPCWGIWYVGFHFAWRSPIAPLLHCRYPTMFYCCILSQMAGYINWVLYFMHWGGHYCWQIYSWSGFEPASCWCAV
jgi:hypothetical protein